MSSNQHLDARNAKPASAERAGTPMRSAHSTFNLFLGLKLDSGRPITFVSEATRSRAVLHDWIPSRLVRQVAFQSIRALDMVHAALRVRKPGAIFIFEHKPQYSLLLYAVCVLKRVPVYFFSHGLQQLQSRSPAHRAGFRLLRWLVARFDFWPILLELGDGVLDPRLQYPKSLTILHPLPSKCLRSRRPIDPGQVVVGMVGMQRPDKPILPLIETLRTVCASREGCRLVIGTPFWQLSDELRRSGVELVDTAGEDAYVSFLMSCDIVVTDFERRSYFFRPSGIINDAVAAGCYVIAPNFPVFAAQLQTPCKVGATYDSLIEIERLISEGASELANGRVDFESWREARRDELLLQELGTHMSRTSAAKLGRPV